MGENSAGNSVLYKMLASLKIFFAVDEAFRLHFALFCPRADKDSLEEL